MAKNKADLLLITGLSGAGKSSALITIEDLGFETLSNFPVDLFDQLLNLLVSNTSKYKKTAILLDIDNRIKKSLFINSYQTLKEKDLIVKLLFLDASNECILKRYSETRRPHPNYDPNRDKNLEDTILRERSRLQDIKELADFVLDSTDLNISEFKQKIIKLINADLSIKVASKLRVNIISFGYKYGLPLASDLVVDVRFLANPFYISKLKNLTGCDLEVKKYFKAIPQVELFLQKYGDFLEVFLPLYQQAGKAYLNIAIGCTGGRHRSVYVTENLADKISSSKYIVNVEHRDISIDNNKL